MSKVPKAEETALVTTEAMSLVPSVEQMDDGFEAPRSGNYLPFLEMVFPVMITPDAPVYDGMDWRLGFKNGPKFEALPAGVILTVVDKRNSVKQEDKIDGGAKNTYAYAGIERKGQQFNKSAGEYNEMAKAAQSATNIFKGFSMVVVALFPDGKTALLDFSAYKTMEGYMYPALSPAMLCGKPPMGVEIQIDKHKDNLTKSKKGYFYPDSKKFKQWKHLALSAEQLTRAVECIGNNSEQYANWLNR
jgi:hypothetical protein